MPRTSPHCASGRDGSALSGDARAKGFMRRYFAEAIGTFILVFAGTGAIVVDQVTGGSITHVGVSLTFGLVVLAMIYSLGDVSGAHLNPAVTVGFWAARRMRLGDVGPYIASQLAGAVGASATLHLMFPQSALLGATVPAGSAFQSVVLETMLTAILMFVVLSVSTGVKEKGIVAGIAVGAVITFEALVGGPVSGASMNPARSIGPALVAGGTPALWVYVVGPVLGALVAVASCRGVHGKECCTR